MPLLSDKTWKEKYQTGHDDLVNDFYVPTLECAVEYDRSTGFFTASVLDLVSRGIEGLVRNNGRMRLIVGAKLDQPEVDAMLAGTSIKGTLNASFGKSPLTPEGNSEIDSLELLSWMVAHGFLDIKVAIPCTPDRIPVGGNVLFHEKAGIVEDKAGNKLAFNGSVNETAAGWSVNWESFHVFTSWEDGIKHLKAEESSFDALWSDTDKNCIVIDIPAAVRDDLLRFLPTDDKPPKRLTQQPSDPNHEARRLAWGIVWHAPALESGERIGEVTAAVTPWAHQERAFHRMYDNWPPKLLIADEVGLGKTIEAGMLLRQAWLSGRAKRVLILAPRGVLNQWQIELREKFNLNWPIYDGHKLVWHSTDALEGSDVRTVSPTEWHREPFVLTSSQLMRRAVRAQELVENAEPYDLVVLDEAHHARRRGAGGAGERGPNQLLDLMTRLRSKTQGLVLLTATPMQIHPIEVWDLLNLLGLPPEWSETEFLTFFDKASGSSPSYEDIEGLSGLFRATEREYGPVGFEDAMRYSKSGSRLATKNVLDALRDDATLLRKRFTPNRRTAAAAVMRRATPASRLISRNTRDLLRQYFESGKLKTPIARRKVNDEFVELTPGEREVYEAVESYISETYQKAAVTERNAVGFVMTIYRRRLASSFASLSATLRRRLDGITELTEDDLPEEELEEELLDQEEAADRASQGRTSEEADEIRQLLNMVKALPADTKAKELVKQLSQLQQKGYKQVIVFTQYTDTMEFLREYLADNLALRIMCYSGRGGEVRNDGGDWSVISRDNTKTIFREGGADILLSTDAASEGLNFQFCGALVNYDMPWSPMKVEQRIGRIDRLGQKYDDIQIANLHYKDTVETDIYIALRERIGLFTKFVGKLQPILAAIPSRIRSAVLGNDEGDGGTMSIIDNLRQQIEDTESAGFDLDEIVTTDIDASTKEPPAYDFDDLDALLNTPSLLPLGISASTIIPREYAYLAPGMAEPLRVTTNPAFFELHPGSLELWSPGSPLFPQPDDIATPEEVANVGTSLSQILSSAGLNPYPEEA